MFDGQANRSCHFLPNIFSSFIPIFPPAEICFYLGSYKKMDKMYKLVQSKELSCKITPKIKPIKNG